MSYYVILDEMQGQFKMCQYPDPREPANIHAVPIPSCPMSIHKKSTITCTEIPGNRWEYSYLACVFLLSNIDLIN